MHLTYFWPLLVFALASSSSLVAQDDSPDIPVNDPEAAPLAASFLPEPAASAQTYTALTLGQNYRYSFNRVFSPSELFLFGVKAAMDQQRNLPTKWGEGPAAYANRYATHFGRTLIRENVAFAVRAIDGEDPRYELSHDTGLWKRSKHAIVRTFVVRGRNGELMPAYSRFVSSFATPLIAQQWEPERFSAGRAFRVGSGGLGFAIASNLGNEFWPDLRRKFLRR